MQSQDLIELGAFVAVHQRELLVEGLEFDRHKLDEYWVVSKCRTERWNRSLMVEMLVQQSQSLAKSSDPSLRPAPARPSNFFMLVSEILSTEILTRVWSALLCAYDDERHRIQASPIARSVFQSQMEARCRVLRILASPTVSKWPDYQQLDRLRRRVERWSDVLLAHTRSTSYIADFAVDPARALRYAKLFSGPSIEPAAASSSWRRLSRALRDAFPRQPVWVSPNVDLHRRLVASVLGDFHPSALAALGVPMTLWLERVQAVAADLECWIDSALHESGEVVSIP